MDAELGVNAETILRAIPPPRVDVVTGRLDTVRHGAGSFRLVLDHGATLAGSLGSDVNKEVLRSFWGKPVTMFGTVRFRPDGRPQSVEANRIADRRPGDEVFAEGPAPGGAALLNLLGRTGTKAKAGYAWPKDLVGTWPGDEPIEDLLAQLKSI